MEFVFKVYVNVLLSTVSTTMAT